MSATKTEVGETTVPPFKTRSNAAAIHAVIPVMAGEARAAGILGHEHMAEPEIPEVSILVPAKNEEATIATIVERLLALPLHKQVVVIDDGSTDRTVACLQPYLDRI
ncbi:MAG: glycosyltransferase, partial [Armatimonadetes bacterium]|nr:glycosyltransferase [Armatimonadota bacterium]